MELGDFSSNDSTPGNHVAPYPTLKPLLDRKRHAPARTSEICTAHISQGHAMTAAPGCAALCFMQTGRYGVVTATHAMMVAIGVVIFVSLGRRGSCQQCNGASGYGNALV